MFKKNMTTFSLILSVLFLASSCKLTNNKKEDSQSSTNTDQGTETDTLPPIQSVHHIDLTSDVMTGLHRMTECVSFLATAKAYSGETIRAERLTGFVLNKSANTPSDLQIYDSENCTGSIITSGAMAANTSTVTYSFKTDTPGQVLINPITNDIGGLGIGNILFGPLVTS